MDHGRLAPLALLVVEPRFAEDAVVEETALTTQAPLALAEVIHPRPQMVTDDVGRVAHRIPGGNIGAGD